MPIYSRDLRTGDPTNSMKPCDEAKDSPDESFPEGTETSCESRGVILHVEDDDDSRAAVCLVVGGAGFTCLEARTPRDALDLLNSRGAELDVLIVDFDLQAEMTGSEVAETISRRLARPLPTVVLTGDPANAEMPWMRDSPVWIARKPLDPQVLLAGLRPLVEFGRAMKGHRPA